MTTTRAVRTVGGLRNVTASAAAGLGWRNFTTGQAAKICGVAPKTVVRWLDRGTLRGYRLPMSRDRRVSREELSRFMREHGMPLGPLAAACRVLIVGADPATAARIEAALPAGGGWEVARAGTPAEAGLMAAGGLAAAVIDCAVGRAAALETAAALRRLDPWPFVAVLANEDEADEAGLLAVADAVSRRPADPAAVAGQLRSAAACEAAPGAGEGDQCWY